MPPGGSPRAGEGEAADRDRRQGVQPGLQPAEGSAAAGTDHYRRVEPKSAKAQELKDAFTAWQITREVYVQKLDALRENMKPGPKGIGVLLL